MSNPVQLYTHLLRIPVPLQDEDPLLSQGQGERQPPLDGVPDRPHPACIKLWRWVSPNIMIAPRMCVGP